MRIRARETLQRATASGRRPFPPRTRRFGVKDFLGNHCAAHSTPLKHEATDLQGQMKPLTPQESTTLEVVHQRRIAECFVGLK